MMKRLALVICCIVLCLQFVNAQAGKVKLACVAFYNLENLFDTLDTEGVDDYEFTPQGSNRYNTKIYYEKLDNLSRVISEIGKDLTPDGAAVIGVSEVENRTVLEDLVSHNMLARRNYQIIHQNSRDERGIDVALLFQVPYFTPDTVEWVRLHTEVEADGDTSWSRDILFVHGLLMGEPITISVNHWPSRYGGQLATDPFRKRAAYINRQIADSLFEINPYHRLLVMGDLNDDPVNESVKEVLYSTGSKKRLKKGQFYNPYYDMFKKGIGTNAYRDAWSLFDQVLLSPGFVADADEGLRFYQAHIFKRSWLIRPLGQYQGYPLRTYGGGVYLGGYSDHLPVYVYLTVRAE